MERRVRDWSFGGVKEIVTEYGSYLSISIYLLQETIIINQPYHFQQQASLWCWLALFGNSDDNSL